MNTCKRSKVTVMKTILRTFLGLGALLVTPLGIADDTDLYLDPNSSIGSEPLVMFSIDYRPNLGSSICGDASSSGCAQAEYFRNSAYQDVRDAVNAIGSDTLTFFHVIQLTLREVFASLSGVQVGLMMSHDDAKNCTGLDVSGCSNGGFILRGFQSLTDDPLTEIDEGKVARDDFLSALDAMPIPQGNVSHSYQGKELFFEFFRYLTGQGVFNAHNGWTDYGTSKNENIDTEYPDAAWDTRIETGGVGNRRYVSPISSQCSKIFTINLMFQVTNQEDDSDDAITAGAAEGGMAGINLTGKNNSFETVIKYLRDNDLDPNVDGKQSVTSYFVVDPSKINQTTTGFAVAGGTDEPLPLAEDPQELVETFQDVFREILSVSTTFVAASVPVNVFNRSESLDNVFIALFEVDEQTRPFWDGNLKKVRIAAIADPVTGEQTIDLVDAQATPITAIAADGRIKYEALTYWTDPNAIPAPEPDTQQVANRDGRVVNRGGAGQQVPGYVSGSPGTTNGQAGARELYYDPATWVAGSKNNLQNLNADATTATALKTDFGVSLDSSALELLKYARGLDIDDLDNDGVTDEARPWLLGDPLHSRPLPINYGSLGGHCVDNPMIFIAMAAQDGFLHFFRNTESGCTEPYTQSGEEVWAFMPREVMDKLSVYRENDIGGGHPYMVDGAPSVYIEDVDGDGTVDASDGDRAILFFGMRRGGGSYYALDVSDPFDPHLLWKIDNSTTGFSELGQTWSQPRVGLVDPDGSNNGEDPVPALFFGGGYDTNKDARQGSVATYNQNGTGTADSRGNAFFVVDATDGSLIWKAVQSGTSGTRVDVHASLTDSIPSDVTIVDTNGDGLTDRTVFGDTGGKVWRVDTHEAIANWQISLLGSFGSDTVRTDDRRFFHRADFVPSLDGPGTSGKFDGIVIGSGDRANPLDRPRGSTRVNNYLFMIKDRNVAPSTTSQPVADQNLVFDNLLDVTDNCLQNNTTDTCDPDDKLANGWKMQLNQGFGEKVLSAPLTLSNTIYVTSFLPLGQTSSTIDDAEAATCGPSEGEGLLYAMKLTDATAVNNYNEYNDTTDEDGDGVNEETLDATDRSTSLASAGIPADVVGLNYGGQSYILPPDLGPRKAGSGNLIRTFWYKVEDED